MVDWKNKFCPTIFDFFLNSTDIYELAQVLNFQTLILKISIFIKRKLQKNKKFSKFYYSPKNGWKTLKIKRNMYHTKCHNVWKIQKFYFVIK